MLSPEKIADLTNDITDSHKNRAAINKLYREQDESHLWPIDNNFNVTDRAIRKAQKHMKEAGYDYCGFEYSYLLDQILSEIVNTSY